MPDKQNYRVWWFCRMSRSNSKCPPCWLRC